MAACYAWDRTCVVDTYCEVSHGVRKWETRIAVRLELNDLLAASELAPCLYNPDATSVNGYCENCSAAPLFLFGTWKLETMLENGRWQLHRSVIWRLSPKILVCVGSVDQCLWQPGPSPFCRASFVRGPQ
jgi:hypothetical protein